MTTRYRRENSVSVAYIDSPLLPLNAAVEATRPEVLLGFTRTGVEHPGRTLHVVFKH
jgi:hypothetical protein